MAIGLPFDLRGCRREPELRRFVAPFASLTTNRTEPQGIHASSLLSREIEMVRMNWRMTDVSEAKPIAIMLKLDPMRIDIFYFYRSAMDTFYRWCIHDSFTININCNRIRRKI